ncbi:MAG TPA: TonB-dependent receptor [Pseudomonadales bacterium]|nr:TonB-dependent receptor [Pseudomonadales bacterium]
MSNVRLRRAIAALTLPAAIVAIPAPLMAAQEPIEEVVVTGSFIRGTPQDAALPVDVFSREDLEDQGNPTITEMIRNLSVSNGNLGETNQFNASGGQGNEGVATINLRGLGSSRTLVLINGRRQVSTPTFGVDISAIPSIAIGRIEVLKDGAAALYGSDAIAGVANFITRDNFEGAEFRASGQYFDESDGEYSLGAIFGGDYDRLHLMGAVEYERRSKVTIAEGDLIRPAAANPQGGYSSIGNPGTVIPITASSGFSLGQSLADPGCEGVGGTVSGNPFTGGATTACLFQFTQFDNLVEEQDTYKFFGEANYQLTDDVEFHFEAMYSKMDMPDWNTSPSYPPQSLFGPDRIIPATHPGIADFIGQNPGLLPADTLAVVVQSRMTGYAGFLGEPENGKRETDTYRVATGLNGELFDGEIGFNVAVSWSKRERRTQGPDMYVERMALALDGLGGPDCDPSTGTPGAGGCMYYTPTSNAIGRSAVTGAVNPNATQAFVDMNNSLFPWLVDDLGTDVEDELLVFDATFDGTLPIELAGGNVGWAVGIQARNEKFDLSPDAINDLSINACPFVDPASVTLGNTDTLDCTASSLTTDTGRFAFLSGTLPISTKRNVYGAFFELAMPFTDRLDAQVAVRFEDYGAGVGSTVDPKVALRFQATDALAFRGSVSTTFRGPPQPFLEGRSTSLQFVGAAAAFKAIDTVGNPNLEPETAVATNFGVIYDEGGFFGSLDYWRFDFSDPLQVEDFNAIVGAFGRNGCAAGGAGVGTAECDSLTSQIVFQPGAAQTAGNISRININYLNGGDVTTQGIDWYAEYEMDTDVGMFTVGTQGTYTDEYDVGDFRSLDGVFLAAGGDFGGNLNDNRNTITPIVDLQGNLFAKYSNGPHRAMITGRYWGEYDDEGAIAALQTIDEMFTVDVTYNLSLMDDALNVNLSIFNLLDEDPPAAQTDLNYDPYTHSAFGRMVKVGLVYSL